MTHVTKLLGLVAALAAAAALAGCGGDGPSKAEFVKKADAACAQTNKAHPPPAAPKNLKEAAKQQAEEIGIRKDLDAKLKDLDVPDDSKDDFDAYNKGTEKIIVALDRARKAAADENETQYGVESQAFEKAAADREKTAIKLGFKICGRQNPVE
jgi:hypothetical protein